MFIVHHSAFIISFLCVLCTSVFSASTVLAHRHTRQSSKPLTQTRIVHINPPGANDSRYTYVPFDVPARASRVHIAYDYDRANGVNTLDLGLFDARFSGRDDDSRGFRGWSGGRRSEIFVSRTEAEYGYLPGALPAGTWRVILGLYRVAPAGVDVTINITIKTDADKISASPPRTSATSPTSAPLLASATSPVQQMPIFSSRTKPVHARRSPNWFRGDLHTHTLHSDGDWTVAQLAATAAEERLDFIFITEHNTSSHHAEIDRLFDSASRPLVLRGEEITTYNGHANAFGLPSGLWLDFRVRAGGERRMREIVREAHRRGALVSINHPTALCKGCDWTYSTDGYDAIEVWNGRWDAEDERALEMWDKLLRAGKRHTAIGSSDTHKPNNSSNALARPTTHIFASALTERALLAGIRAGQVYVTSEPNDLRINFRARTLQRSGEERRGIGDALRLNESDSIEILLDLEEVPDGATVLLQSHEGELRRFTPDARRRVNIMERVSLKKHNSNGNSFLRVEVRDRDNQMLLFTNPIYTKAKRTNKR